MARSLPALYRSILGSAIRNYKTHGIIALLAYYCLIGFFYIGLPLIMAKGAEWLSGTNKGWPALLFGLYFIVVSVPLLPVLFVMVLLFGEWFLNITRANRYFDIPDFALRNSVEKWTQK